MLPRQFKLEKTVIYLGCGYVVTCFLLLLCAEAGRLSFLPGIVERRLFELAVCIPGAILGLWSIASGINKAVIVSDDGIQVIAATGRTQFQARWNEITSYTPARKMPATSMFDCEKVGAVWRIGTFTKSIDLPFTPPALQRILVTRLPSDAWPTNSRRPPGAANPRFKGTLNGVPTKTPLILLRVFGGLSAVTLPFLLYESFLDPSARAGRNAASNFLLGIFAILLVLIATIFRASLLHSKSELVLDSEGVSWTYRGVPSSFRWSDLQLAQVTISPFMGSYQNVVTLLAPSATYSYATSAELAHVFIEAITSYAPESAKVVLPDRERREAAQKQIPRAETSS